MGIGDIKYTCWEYIIFIKIINLKNVKNFFKIQNFFLIK